MLLVFVLLLVMHFYCHSDRVPHLFSRVLGRKVREEWRNPFAMERKNRQESLVASGTKKGSLDSGPIRPDFVGTHRTSAWDDKVGIIFITYLFFHASIRFTLEFLRLDIQPIFLGLRLFQWFAIAEFILAIALFIFLKKWYNKKVINNQ